MFSVPPAIPGPVPPAPAISVMPRGVTGPAGGEELPVLLVSVIRAAPSNLLLRLILFAAQISILPAVVVIPARFLSGSSALAELLTIFTSRPALNKMLPPELEMPTLPSVVIFAFTLISRPQHTTKFPQVAVMAALMFVSRTASKVRVVGVPEVFVQETASFTLISPFTPLVPSPLRMVTLFSTKDAPRVEPAMSAFGPPMLKSGGSINQVPVSPVAAEVVIRAVS